MERAYYGGRRVLDFIMDMDLGFCEGNAVKYIARWRNKGGTDDLRKAIDYLEELIERNKPVETSQPMHDE